MSEWNRKIIAEFRANTGRVGGPFQGAHLVLLTTTGARTGQRRTNPVGYVADGDRILVFASNAGAPAHPAWYHNLLAHPEVTVEIGTGDEIETYPATARPLQGAERDRLYARQAELVPAFAGYQAETSRIIPVVALYRTGDERRQALGDELVRIHADLRAELAAIRAEVEDRLAGRPTAGDRTAGGPRADASASPPGLGSRLLEHCLAFCDAIHTHHARETDAGFPRLERRFPELGPALDRLRREHDVLACVRAELQETLTAIGSADPDQIRADLARLASELERHFDHEEKQLVEALNAL